MKHIKKLFVLGIMICAALIFCGCSLASRTSYIYQYGDSYTAGDRTITKDIDTINIDYRSEEVNIIGTDADCISITETCENEIDDARKVHSFIDGSTLYIRYCASSKNMDLNKLKKRLTVSIPSGCRPKRVLVNVSSSTVNCSGFDAGSVSVYSSSGDINIGCESNVYSLTASSGNIKMEQSAIEDLKIDIDCPDGSSCNILPNPNFEHDFWNISQYFRVNMGSAYRPDVVSCNASLNPMGEPWNYVWSNNSTLGYQYASSNGSCFNSSNFHSHYNPHWDDSNYDYFGDSYHSYSVDSSNLTNMSQIYHPYQNFNSLVGCPLNGNWYIQVQDMMQEDNGYIVEWELALNPDLLPSIWEYTIDVDTFYFTGDHVLDGSTLQPQTTGNPTFGLTLFDDFGCQYDTTFQITVQEWPEVNLGEDIFVCPGTSVYLYPTPANSNYQYTWNTGSAASGFYTSEPGTYSVTASAIVDGLTCSSSDTVELHNFVVSDTTFLVDTICQGYDYENYGFSISAEFLSQELDQQPNLAWDWFTGIQTAEDQNGCDSLVRLHLVVFRHWQKEETVFSCERYIWDGDTLTESGDYVKNFVSQLGCDSTVTLHLNIEHPSEYEIWKTACGSYYWNNIAISESGDYTNTFTSTGDCDSIVTLHLTIVDTVLRSYNSNPDFCTTEETTLSVEGNFDNYIWNTGEIGPSIIVTASGYYSVTASNEVCERTAKFEIPYCLPHLYLPTAITPGKADGLNDFLSLSEYDKSQISEFNIDIFNRWGELVFTSNDKNFRWDGSKNGKYFINTVYNYVIRYTDRTGKPYRILGNITVL